MASQIAVRLPDELLAELDWVVTRIEAPSRADVVRIALERLVDHERRREIDEAYATAYTAQPQHDTDVAIASQALASMVAAEPWDDLTP